MKRWLAVLALTGSLALGYAAGCGGNNPLSRFGRPASPYEQYVERLREAGLDGTALGRDWTRAGDASLGNPVAVTAPFTETGYFPPETPTAAAYRIELRRGRRLAVDVAFESRGQGQLFVDLFRLADGEAPRRVVSLAPEARSLAFDVDRDGTYVLRLQPELLRGGRYTVVERTLASLPFPVSGLTAGAVQSRFGVDRDGGARSHEGIDIFASRGTPVVAVSAGLARPGTNGLGGTVVWLHDRKGGRAYYYAHLDRAALERPAAVRSGDVLGYVGNTGNARTTAPHLHFGIYARRAVDPLPFLQPDDAMPAPPRAPAARLGEWVRVARSPTALRGGVRADARVLGQLERASVARVLGISQSSFRVALPDDSVGYVQANAVAPAHTPVRRDRLPPGAVILEGPAASAPVVDVFAGVGLVDVLGTFNRFDFVRLASGQSGWADTRRTAPGRPPAP
jgi:murein DD-endopeptidase MepM/ murein hydrolase activator NlpD